MKDHKRWILFSLSIVFGLSLIVGATRNLPASAQGLVTGRNDILIDQLVARVGAPELTVAVVDAGIVNPPRRNRESRRNQDSRNRQNRRLDGALDDQLERIEPEIVYQVVVDAGLISQAEAERMLEQ